MLRRRKFLAVELKSERSILVDNSYIPDLTLCTLFQNHFLLNEAFSSVLRLQKYHPQCRYF
jgi:hypothetical protein